MNTTTSATPQARTQDVVIPCLAAIDAAFTEYKNTPTRDNANAFQNLLADAAAMLSSARPHIATAALTRGKCELKWVDKKIVDQNLGGLVLSRPEPVFVADPEGPFVLYADLMASGVLGSPQTTPSTWLPMASAPVGEAAVSVDIWCGDSECRRTDCFWFEGRWCYEVFEDKYRVIPVRAPAAWMPAPTKPEFLAA